MSTILSVDDSTVDRKLVAGLFKDDPTIELVMAENGNAALKLIKEEEIDLVLTDLLMPDLNGLELVKSVRADYPQVPVILMTGHGNELLALDALQQGAASYVPKSNLSERLMTTVSDVLVLARTERAHQEMLNCFDRTKFELTLESILVVELFDPLVEYCQQIVNGIGLCDETGGYQVGVALREALLNALYRGNLEITPEDIENERVQLLKGISSSLYAQRQSTSPYCDRKIYVSVCISKDDARFVVRDEGPGFDVSKAPISGDATVIGASSGRGLI